MNLTSSHAPAQLRLSPDPTLDPDGIRLSAQDLRVLSSKMEETESRSPNHLHSLHPLADPFNRGKQNFFILSIGYLFRQLDIFSDNWISFQTITHSCSTKNLFSTLSIICREYHMYDSIYSESEKTWEFSDDI